MEQTRTIIQQLKKNEKPFGLMSEEMQEKLKSIPGKDIECLQTANGKLWTTCEQGIAWNSQANTSTCTYRLRDDYKDELETIEVKRLAIEAVMEILQKELDK